MSKKIPKIELSTKRVGCDVHVQFADKWPEGYIKFSIILINLWFKYGSNIPAAIENIEKILDKIPICCRVSDEQLMKAYKGCGIGRMKRCTVCGMKGFGTPYTTTGKGKYEKHACFTCVIYKGNFLKNEKRWL